MTGTVAIYMPTDGNAVFIKQQFGKAGDYIHTHKHNFEHYSILASGKAIIERDGKEEELTGPVVVTVEAGINHKITFMTDTAWFCVHGTKERDETRIDETLVN